MKPQTSPLLEQQIRALISEEPGERLRALLEGTEPVVIADVYYQFSVAEQQMLLGVMGRERAADVLIELDEPVLEQLTARLPPKRLAAYIELMEPDDGADVLEIMEPAAADRVLEALAPVAREHIRVLLTYGAETAGGIMDPDVVQIRASQTVAQAIAEIRRYVQRVELDDFFSVFVIDEGRRLVGVVPNWKMLLAEGSERVQDLMIPDPIRVQAHTDQEEVAHLVRDHDLVTIPVVNTHVQLIGRITVDDIVDVIEEEHHEDIGQLTGTGGEGVREISLVQTLRDRAPWLFIALAGQLLAAVIMRFRQDFLITLPQLALFIPAIMAMGGNTGIQSASLVIRGLATGEVRLSHFWRRLLREFLVAACIGVVFAAILILGSVLLTGHFSLGVVVGLTTLATITIASTAGLVIPFVLSRLDLDPALATGPFLTTMNDVVGISVYLLAAYLILF